MPHAIVFQLRKKLLGALLVEVLDTAPAAGCNNLELLRMNLQEPRNERTAAAFKMPKHTDFIGEALIGFWSAERFMDTPIVTDANLGPQRILHLIHAGAKMAQGKDQASSEAESTTSLSRWRNHCFHRSSCSPFNAAGIG